MSRRRDLIAGARSGRLRSRDVIEPTITVTNLGDRGADVVFGVIYPPQVALVGFGAIAERPSVHEGEMVVHPTVVATLSGDHRAHRHQRLNPPDSPRRRAACCCMYVVSEERDEP